MSNRTKIRIMVDLENAHMQAETRLLRLRREVIERGENGRIAKYTADRIANEMIEELHTLKSNYSYGRYFGSYKYTLIDYSAVNRKAGGNNND